MRKIVSRLSLIIALGMVLLQSVRTRTLSAQIMAPDSPPQSVCAGTAYTCITGFPEECCKDGSWACPTAEGESTCN